MSVKYTSDVDYCNHLKILIIGDSSVGKTTLSRRYILDHFSTKYIATIGLDFQSRILEIDSKLYHLQIWDTAGQDRFKCIVPPFYRNTNGVIICFDITDLASFHNVDHWLEEVNRYCSEPVPIFLVGTKSDLKIKRMVSDEMIKAYIEKHNLPYVETSSKTNENIEKCFVDFTKILVEHINQSETAEKKPQIQGIKLNLDKRQQTFNILESVECFNGSKCKT